MKGITIMCLIPFDEDAIRGLIVDMPYWMHPIQWWRRQFYIIADENAVSLLIEKCEK